LRGSPHAKFRVFEGSLLEFGGGKGNELRIWSKRGTSRLPIVFRKKRTCIAGGKGQKEEGKNTLGKTNYF